MMGTNDQESSKLFYSFQLEKRIPRNHPLRALKSLLKLDFLYEMLKDKYGSNGNVSVPPPILMKMMLLLVLYNVSSERELMRSLPLRLDWLWFLGYNIDTEIPHHSVLSKARKRWGEKVFKKLFDHVVLEALHSGLVDGKKLFADSSLVEAVGSKNSVVDLGDSIHYMELLESAYDELLNRLDGDANANEQEQELSTSSSGSMESDESIRSTVSESVSREFLIFEGEKRKRSDGDGDGDGNGNGNGNGNRGNNKKKNKKKCRNNNRNQKVKVNDQYKSLTDPEATLVRHKGDTQLYYKVHRSVDESFEIITGCRTTTGMVNEADMLDVLVWNHKQTFSKAPEVAVADSKYGTQSNFINLVRDGIKTHIKDLSQAQEEGGLRGGKYSKEEFVYNGEGDYYVCPGGEILKKRSYNPNRGWYEYKANKHKCLECERRSQCTSDKNGRTVKRHPEEEFLELGKLESHSQAARSDLKKRQHLMERSFAVGLNYGYKQARWRGVWKVSIQQYLIATVQNLKKILKYGLSPAGENANRAMKIEATMLQRLGLGKLSLAMLVIKSSFFEAFFDVFAFRFGSHAHLVKI